LRGRKPKPTHLKVLDGNPGRRPIDKGEPQPERAIPTCPSHLCPSAKAEWKRLAHELHELGVLTHLDRAALAAYCQAYGRWVEAERKLVETPTLLKLPSGYLQHNPWLTIATKQLELMHKYMAELGLTPSSRTRVSVARPLNRSRPPWEFGERKLSSVVRGQRPWLPADDYLSR
jgi:P27 family predicted phage terminase small subunit